MRTMSETGMAEILNAIVLGCEDGVWQPSVKPLVDAFPALNWDLVKSMCHERRMQSELAAATQS